MLLIHFLDQLSPTAVNQTFLKFCRSSWIDSQSYLLLKIQRRTKHQKETEQHTKMFKKRNKNPWRYQETVLSEQGSNSEHSVSSFLADVDQLRLSTAAVISYNLRPGVWTRCGENRCGEDVFGSRALRALTTTSRRLRLVNRCALRWPAASRYRSYTDSRVLRRLT